ncbi:MAG: hypothetical protein IK026_07010, partial [Eubacteriaceae bacterium]|nr:hypothetical protein [Eubacteriaceae bacterium]
AYTTIWIESLEQYKQSWESIIGKYLAVLYPGHGNPFRAAELETHLKVLDSVKRCPLRGGRETAS